MDEAHHSASRTWSSLLTHLSNARRILFTATPFRSDRKEVPGRLVYSYDLSQAYRDGVFGSILYHPVTGESGVEGDKAIARAAAAQFRSDKASGLDHLLMVRTGQKSRAKELLRLYEQETDLRLQLVLGDHSLPHVRSVLSKLDRRELDGLICVDMLGEGFNLPQLKIAALHTPHRSLGVTLQFIGRFARTTAPGLGAATFFALESEMEIERVRLFERGAVWQEIVQDLSEDRVRRETQTREVLSSFVARDSCEEVSEEDNDLSLYALQPYFHVKIYEVGPDINLEGDIEFPKGMNLVRQFDSAELGVTVCVTQVIAYPDWIVGKQFLDQRHDLFIFYHQRESGLLFICATRRLDPLYELLAAQLVPAGMPAPRILSSRRLNRVLLDLDNCRFFNIGLRNSNKREEAYQTRTGSHVAETVVESDGHSYRRGHWYGSAEEAGQPLTIGLSTASKVWSNTSGHLPELLAWCDKQARKISSNRTPQTFGGLDHLDTGEEVTCLPPHISFVSWPQGVFKSPPRLLLHSPEGEHRFQLLDLDIAVDHDACTSDEVVFALKNDAWTARFSFTINRPCRIQPLDPVAEALRVVTEMQSRPFADYMNAAPPTFHTSDFSCLDGATFYPQRALAQPFNASRIQAVDWQSAGVDIELEFGSPSANGCSIHDFLAQELPRTCDIVFYDHGSGEIADYVTFAIQAEEVRIGFHHCKSSGGRAAGRRVDDAYEVCGQAIKSRGWADRQRLLSAIKHRLQTRRGVSRFICGDLTAVESVLRETSRVRLVYEMVLVQPGFSQGQVNPGIASLLAATDDFLYGGSCDRLRIQGSA